MTNPQATAVITNNSDGSQTHSIKLSEMSVEQLAMINQALGRKIDELRAQRAMIRELTERRLEADRMEAIRVQMAKLQAEIDGVVDGTASGATVDLTASGG